MSNCAGCKHWGYEFRDKDHYLVSRVADCRRHAPHNAPLRHGDGWPGRERGWPQVRGDDWCGDFEARSVTEVGA